MGFLKEKATLLLYGVFSYFQKPDDQDYSRDCAAITRITCAAWLLTLALSWRAYIPGARIFSLSPVIDFLAVVPGRVDWFLFVLNIGLLAWLLVKPLQRIPAVALLGCTVFWILQDLMRFQPYTYMYFITVLLAVFWASPGINALKIMIGGVYFWAGFHKFNLTFCFGILPRFISPFYIFPQQHSESRTLAMIAAGCAVALFESLIGVFLLLSPGLKRVATGMAFIMLVVALACLGPTGRNMDKIVWPWNLYLFLIEVILFLKPSAQATAIRWQPDVPVVATVALFLVAPGLAIPGWWPSYPAFKLFSGNIQTAQILFADDENISHLPDNLGQFIADGERQLPVISWTLHEFEMVVYPSPYVFRSGTRGLCPYLGDPQKAQLRIYEPPLFYRIQGEYQDFPLCPHDKF